MHRYLRKAWETKKFWLVPVVVALLLVVALAVAGGRLSVHPFAYPRF
jgi:uncharacterized protein DUF5989